MSSRFDLIAQAILKKPFAHCSLSELEELAHAHPAFAPAHFLWVKKLQQSGISNPEAAMQKSALYYHQPALFGAFLHSDDIIIELPETAETTEATEAESHNTANITTQEWAEPTTDNENLHEPEEAEKEVFEKELPKDAIAEAKPVGQEIAATEAPAFSIAEAKPIQEPKPSGANFLARANEDVADTNFTTETVAPAPLSAAPPQHEPLLFEPFHTVDYFASQGIKLSQAEIPQDKFGKQLKSFTEWLKTMKKLPASEQTKNLDLQAEQKVENLAAHSVAGADVVTETMAEVWIKQGNMQKAAEVYQKLSLLNPSKRAYFAAKLQNLK